MVRVLMRHQDRIQAIDVLAYGGQAFGDLPPAQAGIDQQARPPGRNKYRVAGAAARKNANLNRVRLRLFLSAVIPDSIQHFFTDLFWWRRFLQ